MTQQKQARTGQVGQAIDDDEDDPVPKNPDEFRFELVRRIQTFLRDWRHCPLRICKRTRACRGRAPFACSRDRPSATPQRAARVMANVKVALERRLAEIDAQKEAAAAAGKPVPRVTR